METFLLSIFKAEASFYDKRNRKNLSGNFLFIHLFLFFAIFFFLANKRGFEFDILIVINHKSQKGEIIQSVIEVEFDKKMYR